MRPPEVVRITWRDEAPYEAAAEFLGVIAYPDDPNRRRAFASALVYLALRETRRGNPEWVAQAPGMSQLDLDATPATATVKFERGMDLVNRRMLAAAMAIPGLLKLWTGRALEIRGGATATITNLSVEAQKVWYKFKGREPPADGGDPNNAQTEIWRPARPVLHLALGLTKALHSFEKAGGAVCTPVTLVLDNPQLIKAAAIMAELYRKLLPELGRTFTPPAQLSSETAVRVSIDQTR